MFGNETLQLEEVMQDIISHAKMNKSSSSESQNEGLLTKGSNDDDPEKVKAKLRIMEDQGPKAVKMSSAITVIRSVTSRGIARSIKFI